LQLSRLAQILLHLARLRILHQQVAPHHLLAAVINSFFDSAVNL
jgi:hypothetical protein